MTFGRIVVLNGTPRAGKSSLVRAMQAAGDWLNLGVDVWMAATPERLRPGIGQRPGGERPDLEPFVAASYAGLFEAVAAQARLGLDVVVDVGLHADYAGPFDAHAEARRLLGNALFVGVRCPVEVVLARRAATGMVAPREIVERWERAVHAGRGYDLEIDTSVLTPEAGAAAIRRLQQGAWSPRSPAARHVRGVPAPGGRFRGEA